MKIYQKIGIVLLGLVGLFFTSTAQQGSTIVFNDADGVHIRWTIQPEAESYNVYSRTGNAAWNKLNNEPVPVITDNDAIREILGGKTDILLGMVGARNRTSDLAIRDITSAASVQDQFEMLQVFALINPEFSKVLGLTYKDFNATGNVQYKITSLSNGNERDWAVTETINTSRKDDLPEVDELTGESTDHSVILSWKKDLAALKRGSVVTYYVYRSNSELGPFGRINYYGVLPGSISVGGSGGGLNSEPGIQQHADKGLENGKSYFYYVKAVNAFGLEGPSSITVEVVPGDFSPPAPPYNINVRQSGNAASLSWSHDDNQLKGFEISRSTTSDGEYETIYPTDNKSYTNIKQFLDFNLSPGLVYYYKIRSVNARDLTGPWSNPQEYINWDKVPPAAPIGLKAITDDEGRITVTWEASTEEDVIGYHIDRATDNNYDWQFRLNMKMLADPVYIDERPPESQTTYGYVVYAVDRSLNTSPASEMVKARLPDIVPPQAPIITALTENDKEVKLEWTKSIADDFSKYKIYRATNELMDMKPVGESTENRFTDYIEQDEGRFLYLVSAIDQDENESEYSKPISLTRKLSPYPDAPISGVIEYVDNKVVITWDAVADERVTGYLISRYTGDSPERKDMKELKTSDPLEFTDKYTVAGRSYLYEIRSHDKDWQLSKPLPFAIELE